MELTEKKSGNCTIIGIKGRLDTTSSNIFEKRIMDLMDQQVNRILINCSEMDYISSSGLRILLIAVKRITREGGKFVICGLQENVRNIFEMSGFNTLFEIYPGEEEALMVF